MGAELQELAPVVLGEAGQPGSVVSDSEMFESSQCGLQVQPGLGYWD